MPFKKRSDVPQEQTPNNDDKDNASEHSNDEDTIAEPPSTMTVADFKPEYFKRIEVAPLSESVARYDPNDARLIISHIDCENFKSYLGKRRVADLDEHFTVVLGPNGSGKSNVIDSLLFVFGYRAQQLRSKKLSVLIHSSDQLSESLPFCSVTIHMKKIVASSAGEGTSETVANSEFAVKRVAWQDNSSAYYVDNRRCQFKDISSLLRSHGVDLDHNRFLILQGEVEQISLLKPRGKPDDPNDEGMLEFLEDIIGSNRLKIPLATISKRMELLNQIRLAQLCRVKAIEAEREVLSVAKTEALRYIDSKNAVTLEKNKLFQKLSLEMKSEETALATRLDELKSQERDQKAELDSLVQLVSESEAELSDISAKLERANVDSNQAAAEFVELEKVDITLQQEIKTTKTKIAKNVKAAENERTKLESLEDLPERNKTKIEWLEKAIVATTQDLEDVEAALETATNAVAGETSKLRNELASRQKAVAKERESVDMATEGTRSCESELAALQHEHTKATKRLAELEDALQTCNQNLTSDQERTNNLDSERQTLARNLAKSQKTRDEANAALDAACKKLASLQGRLADATTSVPSRSGGKILDFLFGLKKRGELPGLIGKLGDLGRISSRFDIAISTAGGFGLDSIVVEDAETAMRAVAALRKHDVGTASFAPLDKMTLENPASAFNSTKLPPNATRLFDLIEMADQKFAPVFYWAIRDTLVAESMDEATRLAFNGNRRFRVVTQSGQLIETSGTMSGGGNRPQKGKMTSSLMTTARKSLTKQTTAVAEDEDPQQLQADIANEKTKIEELKRVLRASDGLETDKAQIKRIDMEKSKIDVSLASNAKQVPVLEKQLQEQKKICNQCKPDPKSVHALEKRLAEERKKLERCQQNCQRMEETTTELKSQLEAITNAKLGPAKARAEELKTKLDKASSEKVKLSAEIGSHERTKAASLKKIEKIDKEIADLKEKHLRIKDDQSALEEKARLAQEKQAKADEVRDELLGRSEQLNKTLKCSTEERSALNIALLRRHDARTKVEGELEGVTNKMKYFTKEVSKLALEKVDGCGESSNENVRPPTLNEEDLAELRVDKLNAEIARLEKDLETQKPNIAAIAEYKAKDEAYLKQVAHLDTITQCRTDNRKHHDELSLLRSQEFNAGYKAINSKLKEMYQLITLGGDAELELVDSHNPFADGVVFSVRPPKKTWKNIANLSGGEKTLSSLALVFALHHYRPTPFYVMDEIDAALDIKNVQIIAYFIRRWSQLNTQFVVISLREPMYELADRYIGVYKKNSVSQTVLCLRNALHLPPPPNALPMNSSQVPQTITASQENMPPPMIPHKNK